MCISLSLKALCNIFQELTKIIKYPWLNTGNTVLTFFISHWSQNLVFKVLIIAFKSLVYLLPCRKHSSSISCYMYTFYNRLCLYVWMSGYNFWMGWYRNLIFGMAVLLTLSRSNLNINVIGSRSRTSNENSNLPTWILNEFDLSEIRTWTFDWKAFLFVFLYLSNVVIVNDLWHKIDKIMSTLPCNTKIW